MKLIKILFLLISVIIFQSCQNDTGQALVIFHAGSLSYPLKKLTEDFQQTHPDQQFQLEPAGSLNTIRKVTDLNRRADIIASADYKLISEMLIPNHTAYNIAFATNSIVLAYTDQSAYADEITSENWIEILKKEEVKIGASDPNADPCGYRTRLTLQLAGKMQDIPNLTHLILEEGRYYERPKETDLIALLETQTIDYFFIYESVAKQHHFKTIVFSDSINLSQPVLNDWYRQESIKVRGSSPTDSILIHGEAIVYGITVLDNSSDTEAAWNFIEFLLDPTQGSKILEASGQRTLIPAFINTDHNLPAKIKPLVTINNIR
ncbi:MAG: extracellular solute-binding protein [Bacteroidales bacterium]|nr:extracellular solute-binding protein [Bacteroidales bacterium]HOI31891.1 extracellular solute-binding protein [Bacteroidales bacterium]